MNKQIFNTPFEVSMRLLILLGVFRNGLDDEKILHFDFFTIYAKNYGFDKDNINGHSWYMLNEFTSQRKLIDKSIKKLAEFGLINISSSQNGFIYSINEEGINICSKMCSEYSIQYKKTAFLIKKAVGHLSINKIKEFARKKEDEIQYGSYQT